jgi:hypothetical protein
MEDSLNGRLSHPEFVCRCVHTRANQKIMEITGDYIKFKTRTRQPTGFSVPAVVWRYYGLNPLDPSTPITLHAERKGREYKGSAYMKSGAEVFAQDPKPSRDPRQARRKITVRLITFAQRLERWPDNVK